MKSQSQPQSSTTINAILLKAKEAAKKNDMLGTAIEVSKLHEMGVPVKEIPSKLKKVGCQVSIPHVYNHIKLADVSSKVKAHIKAGRINPTDVLELMHKHQTKAELSELVDKKVAELEKEFKIQHKSKLQIQMDRLKERMVKELKKAGLEPKDSIIDKFIQTNLATN